MAQNMHKNALLLIIDFTFTGLRLHGVKTSSNQPNGKCQVSKSNGRITANHIEIDCPSSSDYCYVVVMEDGVKILLTRPIKPNGRGKVAFPGLMVFDHKNCNFHIKMSLYKLRLVNHPARTWTEKVRVLRNGVELPQFELVGYRIVNMATIDVINQNALHFNDAITLYIQFRITVSTKVSLMHTPLALGCLFNKKFLYGGRLAVFQDTDLKLYKTARDLKTGKTDFVVSLFKCKSCEIYESTGDSEILKLKTESNDEILIYFDNKTKRFLWQNAFNFAIATANKWKNPL